MKRLTSLLWWSLFVSFENSKFWFYEPIMLHYCREPIFISWCVLSLLFRKLLRIKHWRPATFLERRRVPTLYPNLDSLRQFLRPGKHFKVWHVISHFFKIWKSHLVMIKLSKTWGTNFHTHKNCINRFSKFYYLLEPGSRTHSLAFPLLGCQSWTGYY